MKLTSSVFKEGKSIPMLYTCEGENINPPLQIDDVPTEAKSLVLIMDDPDVPEFVRKDRMYVHWVIFNMPPTLHKIEENSVPPGVMGAGTGRKKAYDGPCPPDREHRYFFKLYALDSLLSLQPGASKEQVEQAMQGRILAKTELMCLYNKKINRKC